MGLDDVLKRYKYRHTPVYRFIGVWQQDINIAKDHSERTVPE